MTRRMVGGYEWDNELDRINTLGERLRDELMTLSKEARTVEHSKAFTQLVGLSSEVSVTALKLRTYQVK